MIRILIISSKRWILGTENARGLHRRCEFAMVAHSEVRIAHNSKRVQLPGADRTKREKNSPLDVIKRHLGTKW